MIRGIFDPTGGDTERSGAQFSPPEAQQISHMPPDVEDGVVQEEVQEEDGQTPLPDDEAGGKRE